MKCAMFPGSLDPPTMGHINIIERSARLYDRLYVVVADNVAKKCLFTAEERIRLIKDNFRDKDNIEVLSFRGLTVDIARELGVDVMIRGVRAAGDFGYEFELAMTNKQLLPSVETLFMPTDPHYFLLRSSAIKEMAIFGADISAMVPANVAKALAERVVSRETL